MVSYLLKISTYLFLILLGAQYLPRFVKEITDKEIVRGDTVIFECTYEGTPNPDVVWYKNDKLLTATKNVKIQYKQNKTTCTIRKVTQEDEGIYICKATSDIGLAVTKAKLTVKGTSMVFY